MAYGLREPTFYDTTEQRWEERTEHAHEVEQAHEVGQKRHTDDQARYHEVKGQRRETGEERPEKGR